LKTVDAIQREIKRLEDVIRAERRQRHPIEAAIAASRRQALVWALGRDWTTSDQAVKFR
jgi:hypothetical protein